jgi:hypothetical protein
LYHLILSLMLSGCAVFWLRRLLRATQQGTMNRASINCFMWFVLCIVQADVNMLMAIIKVLQ